MHICVILQSWQNMFLVSSHNTQLVYYSFLFACFQNPEMSLRKYESGAVKRKKAAEKKLKEESIIKQTARIETFFTQSVSDYVTSSSSAEIERTSVPVEHQEAQLHNQHDNDDVNKQPYGHEEASLTIENKGNTSLGLYESDLGLHARG